MVQTLSGRATITICLGIASCSTWVTTNKSTAPLAATSAGGPFRLLTRQPARPGRWRYLADQVISSYFAGIRLLICSGAPC
jgi:hypothetical protein